MLPLNHRPLSASVVVYLHKIAFLFAPAVTQITSDIMFHISLTYQNQFLYADKQNLDQLSPRIQRFRISPGKPENGAESRNGR